MAVKHFQIGRGTYDKAVVYTGLVGELILDTTNMQVRVHDGETMGGYPIAKDVLATSSARGLMAPEDKAKLDTLQNYVLPTAGLNKLGGVKTTSTVTSASGYTACPIISGVPYYANIPAISLYVGAVDAKADAATSNGATYLKLFSDNTLSKQFNIKGSGATTVTSDASGSLIINSVNTTYTAAINAPLAPGTAAVGTSAKYAREDHVHPVQTTISGNAGTATKLANGAKIGISGAVTGTATLFDGSANITIPTTGIDVSKANAGTLPVFRGGTGQTSVANIQAGKDAAGNVITETYATKTEVNNLRSGLVQTVPALPETGTEGIIYLVPNTTDPNTYDQFTWENGAYVPLGNTSFNLGDYVKKENVITALSVSGRTITYTKGDGTTGTLTTQDNNTTYSAGTGLSLSGTTFSVSSTAGSSALSWGTEVTLGTVGGLAIKAKLPANPNSDTKVTQNISTTSSTYPVLLTPTANANANVGASTAIFGAGIKANPSTGELIATKFTGALAGNANTATKATQDSAGQQINTTYIKGLSVSGKTITYTKGDGTTGTITTQDTNTTYSVATTSANGLMSADDKAKLDGLSNYVLPTAANGILGGVKTSSTVTSASGYTACPIIDGIPYYKDTNTTYTLSSLGIGNVKNYDQSKAISSITRSGTTFTYTCLDGTTGTFTQQDNNTTYSNFVKSGSGAKAGLVPAPSTTAGTTKYLREDGTWQVPPNTTYSVFVKSGSGAASGLVPAPSTTAGTTKYLREDGTWVVPPNTTYTFTAGTSTLAWNTEVTLATVGGVAIKAKLPANPHSSTATAVRPGNLANGAYSDVVSVSASDKSTDGTANRVATIRLTNGDGYNEMLLGVHNEANAAPGGIAIRNTNGTTTTTIAGTTIGTFQGDLTGTATKATQDSAGQQIDTTYIKGLSVSGRTITYTKGDGTTGTITTQDSNTTYSNFVKSGSGAKAGLVPAPSTTAGTTKYLREDCTWQVPPNTTYSVFVKSGSGAASGLVPAPSTTAGTTKYLREDGTWSVPPDTNTTYTFTAGTSTLSWNTEVTLATVGGLAIKAKLPSNPNSDTKVTQNLSTTNNTYPVLLTPTANATANAGATTAIFGSGIKANPSTGELIATKFTGALSGTATKATQDSAGQQIDTTYIKGLSVSGRTITYTKGDGTTGTITTQDNNTWTAFKGATSSAAGTAGYVPAPAKGDQAKFFRADGTWVVPTNTTYSAGTGLTLSGTTFSVTANTYAAASHTHSYLPLSGGTVTGTLILSRTTDASGTANNKPALIIGGTDTTAHIEIDNNEIMAKKDGTTTDVLYLNTDGGLVSIGSGGLKTSGNITIAKSSPQAVFQDTRATKGTAPSSNIWNQFFFVRDSAGIAYGGLEHGFKTTLENRMNLIVYQGTTNNTSTNAQIAVGFDADGNWFTYAPTPADADNSTKMATTAWVRKYSETTKKFLTSHQSLANYSTLANTIKDLSISGRTITYTKGDGTTGTLTTQDNNTTYSNFVKSGSGAKAGLVPAPSTTAGTTKYLREDGTWSVPPDTNTTYTFTAGTSTLAWNSEVTLATVGGLAIKAKLPANPNTNTTYSAGTGLALSGTTFSVPVSLPLGNIEFNRNGASSNNGGFIDFHYNQSTADYTSRIIESASGVLDINGVTFTKSGAVVKATTFQGAFSGNASTATKLATARSISAGNKDFVGSASFDGSGNITLNVLMDWCRANLDKANNYPYHRIATTNVVTGNFQDYTVMLLINKAYTTGGYGIIRIALRTESGTNVASAEAKWIARSADLPVDCIQLGLVNTPAKAVVDVFYKAGGVYQAVQVRALGHSKNRYQDLGVHGFTLITGGEDGDSTATDPKTSTECWATIAAAATALGRGSYSSTIVASDAGVVSNAATATKLATARTIALSGAVTGSKTFDGSGNITIPTSLKACYVTVEGEAVTNNIFKFATADLTGSYNVYSFYILIQSPFFHRSAIWHITIGASSTAGVFGSCTSQLINNIDLDVSDFFVGYKNNSGSAINIALYCKVVDRYDGYRFTIISETKRGTIGDGSGAYLTLTNKTRDTGTAAVDSGYTVINTVNATVADNISGNAATATKATQDSAGQQINTTYIKALSVSGKTITYTKGNGTTGTITTQDTNTTYTFTAGTSALSWNTEVTLATVGGLAIKAKLPANPNTNTTYSAGTGLSLSGTTFSVKANTYAAYSHTHNYLPLSGGTLTGQLIIDKDNGSVGGGLRLTGANQNYAISIINTGITKGTAPTATKYGGIDFYGATVSSYKNRVGMIEYMLDTNNVSSIHLRAYNCTGAENSATSTISAYVDGSGNVYTAAPTPAFGDHSTKIATTAWVHDNALYTKRSGMDTWSFITSSASMTNGSMSSATSMAFAMYASNSDLTTNLVNGKKIGGVGMYAKDGQKMSGLKVAFYTSTTAASEIGFDLFTAGSPGSQKTSVLFRHGGHGEVFGPSPSWSAAFSANADTGTVLLGSTTYLWKQVCAKTSSIATSDERLKTQIDSIPDEILDAWGDLQYKQFKWIDTVEKEGEAARLHVGAVAQAVERMFQSKGIDVTKYSFFCHTPEEPYEWTEEVEVEPGVKEEKVVKGVHPDRYALRYADMLVIEAVYQRRRADRAEARLAALEDRLSRVEKALNLS